MGCDRALALYTDRPVLRFYTWKPPAVSAGYFQTPEEIAPLIRKLGDVPVVRRMTGGGAIYHYRECTYSICAPAGMLRLPPNVADSYRLLHAPFISVFRSMGIEAEDRTPVQPDRRTVCFDSVTSYDVTVHGRKLMGSAQRRTKRFFLQHGSIPLEKNPLAETATSLEQETGSPVTPEELQELLIPEISKQLGIEFALSELTDEEQDSAAETQGSHERKKRDGLK
jgi:lipoate-protein ligase A